jgi:hypothetical protein
MCVWGANVGWRRPNPFVHLLLPTCLGHRYRFLRPRIALDLSDLAEVNPHAAHALYGASVVGAGLIDKLHVIKPADVSDRRSAYLCARSQPGQCTLTRVLVMCTSVLRS